MVVTDIDLDPLLTGETLPMPLLIDADVPAEVVHVMIVEPPPYVSVDGLVEMEQVGTGASVGDIDNGGGGEDGGGSGSVQHGGATCACASVGMLAPVANAIIAPNRSVATIAATPIKIGLLCIDISVIFFIYCICVYEKGQQYNVSCMLLLTR